MMRTNSANLATAALLAALAGCASTVDPKESSLTIERILTEPLTGIAGRDRIRAGLNHMYGLDPAGQKYMDKEPRTLADRHVLSMLWLEPLPADFIAIAVSGEPCFPVERALRLTQAKLHNKIRSTGAQTYDAFRNGMLVSFSTTPDEKCVSFIHIERDR